MWWRLAFPLIFMFAPRLIPRMARTAYLVWKLILDNRVPLLLRLLVPATLIYFVTPFARVPYIGLVGYLLVFLFAVWILLSLAPRNVVGSYAPWMTRGRAEESSSKKDSSRVVEGSYRLPDEEDSTNNKQ